MSQQTKGLALPADGAPPGLTIQRVVADVVCLCVGVSAAVAAFSTDLVPFVSIPLAILAASFNVTRWRPTKVDVMAVLFAAISFCSVIWSLDPDMTLAYSWRLAGALGLFIWLRMALQGQREVISACVGYLAGCLWIAYQLAQVNTVKLADLRFDSFRTETIEGLNANYLAYSLAGGAALLAYATARSARSILMIPALVVLYWGISLTGSRGGLVAFGLAVVWWLIPAGARKRLWKPLLLGVCVAVAALTTGLLDAALRAAIPASRSDIGDLNGRLDFWPIARDVMGEHLWLGAGAGTFPSLNPYGFYAHNAFLDVGAGIGLVGLAIFISLLTMTFREGVSGSGSFERHLFAGMTVAALLPPLISGVWYQSPAIFVLLAITSRMQRAFPDRDPTELPARE